MDDINHSQLAESENPPVLTEMPFRTSSGVSVITSDVQPEDGWTPMSNAEFEEWRNREPEPWTDGVDVRYAFECDLPGWRKVEDGVELQSLLLARAHAQAAAQATELRRQATELIAGLQDAVDDEVATEHEVELLAEWKTYRIALRRVVDQPGYPTVIDWPVMPT